MATYNKSKLSGSTSGRSIPIGVTASATTIHTAVASTGANVWDEIYLYAYNSHTIDLEITIQWGGTTSPDDDCKITIPSKSGRYLIVDGRILQNSLLVKAYAPITGVVMIDGYVNSIT